MSHVMNRTTYRMLACAGGLVMASWLWSGHAQAQRQPVRSVAWIRPQAEPPAAPVDDLSIRLKLAWLADPLTFPLRLGVQTTPGGVRIFGYAPSAGIKKRALDIAAAQSGLKVQDGVQIMATMVVGGDSPLPTGELLRLGQQLLNHQLPYLAPQVLLSVTAEGHLIATGVVQSAAERWQVCHALQQLPGCQAIVCQLSLSPLSAEPMGSGNPSAVVAAQTTKRPAAAEAAPPVWTAARPALPAQLPTTVPEVPPLPLETVAAKKILASETAKQPWPPVREAAPEPRPLSATAATPGIDLVPPVSDAPTGGSSLAAANPVSVPPPAVAAIPVNSTSEEKTLLSREWLSIPQPPLPAWPVSPVPPVKEAPTVAARTPGPMRPALSADVSAPPTRAHKAAAVSTSARMSKAVVTNWNSDTQTVVPVVSVGSFQTTAAVPAAEPEAARTAWTKVEFSKRAVPVSRFRHEGTSFPEWAADAKPLPIPAISTGMVEDKLVRVKAETSIHAHGISLEPPVQTRTQEKVSGLSPRPLSTQVVQKPITSDSRKLGKAYRSVAAVTWESTAQTQKAAPRAATANQTVSGIPLPQQPPVAATSQKPVPLPVVTTEPPLLPASATASTAAPLPAATQTPVSSAPPVAQPAAAAQLAAPAGRPAPPSLQHAVASAAQGLGNNLIVYLKNDGKLFISVDVLTQEAAAVLFQRLNTVPELGPLAIEFKARVVSLQRN